MHPILFQLGAITIYSYGVLVAAGVIVALIYARRRALIVGLPPREIWDLGIYMIFAALIASKIWLILTGWNYYSTHPSNIFSIATFESAGTFYGGLVGSIVMILVYCRVRNLPLLPVFDVSAAALPLAHALGRLGCFAAGCCFGKPTTVPWGVIFTDEQAARLAGTPLNVPLHPTQLYEAAAEFLNFLLLVWLGARQKFSGQILGAYFMLYGLERAIIEVFRGDPGRTLMFHGSLSLMQIVSVGLVLTGAALWWRGFRGSVPPPNAAFPADPFATPATK